MIVTREKITNVLDGDNQELKMHWIGRALVVLLNNQTRVEAQANVTNMENGVGFTSSDAKSGCISAKYYLKNRRLEDWQIQRWLRKDKRGTYRIAKYWKQLDMAAQERAKKEKNE